jgi:hypothetical protein
MMGVRSDHVYKIKYIVIRAIIAISIGIGATVWLGYLTSWKVSLAIMLILFSNNIGRTDIKGIDI